MDVTQQWVSQSTGWHQAVGFTKQWMPQGSGCHKATDVTKQWMSQGTGCHRALDVKDMAAEWQLSTRDCCCKAQKACLPPISKVLCLKTITITYIVLII